MQIVNSALQIKDNFSVHASTPSLLIRDSSIAFRPLVSVVVPTYKRIDTLAETIESILSQKNFEQYDIIICDNCSERGDVTEQYVCTLTDPRIKYYKNAENIGMFGNINRLYELSDAEYTVCIHDDDLLYPRFLEITYSIMKRYPHIDILFPHKVDWRQGEEPLPRFSEDLSHASLYRLDLWDFITDNDNSSPTGFIAKTKSMLELGGFDLESYPSNDYYFNIKASINKNVYSLTHKMYAYRWADNASLKKETIIGWMKRDIPVKKWIANKNPFLSLLCRQFIIRYSLERWHMLMKLYPETSPLELPKCMELPQKPIFRKANFVIVNLFYWIRSIRHRLTSMKLPSF